MKVLITGGTGTIGTALRATDPNHIFGVLSRCEHKQAPLRAAGLRCFVADVADAGAVRRAVTRFAPDLVIHAAAAKHVSTGELDPPAVIRSNIEGTRAVVEACQGKLLVVISTDKACEPTTAYGATKMLAERIVYDSAAGGAKHYVVRYGNVFGSNGSYSRYLLEQWLSYRSKAGPLDAIGAGLELTLTSPGATRFWWSPYAAAAFIWGTVSDYWVQSYGKPRPRLYVPRLPAASMHQIVTVLLPAAKVKTIGMMVSEKKHETIITKQDGAVARDGGLGWTAPGGPGCGSVTSQGARELTQEQVVALAYDSAVELDLLGDGR